jgi:pimeloyl-ACP methyl ester carboxylesterase
MATDYLANHHDPRIKGFVGIGMIGEPRPYKYRVLDNVIALQQVTLPVLGIYGSQTITPVLNTADRRAYVIYHNGSARSRQIEIKGANHFFRSYEDDLVQSITSWLAESITINPQIENKAVVKNEKPH